MLANLSPAQPHDLLTMLEQLPRNPLADRFDIIPPNPPPHTGMRVLPPADGEAVLDDVHDNVQRFLFVPDEAAAAITLWIAHTHVHDTFQITPRLALCSPTKRCGKTTALMLLEALVLGPLSAANLTPAVAFRILDEGNRTLLVDEADTFLGSKRELQGVLNAGHRRGQVIHRVIGKRVTSFHVFGPVAIAKIGPLPSALADRSIIIGMRRRSSDETCERLSRRHLGGELRDLAARLRAWAEVFRPSLGTADPAPVGLSNDRAEDNWLALLAIADAVGGRWPTRARAAARCLSEVQDEEEELGVQLLRDIHTEFQCRAVDRLTTTALVASLTRMEERPWPECKGGGPITPTQVARLLKPFGIRPKHFRFDGRFARGYELSACRDAFARYLADTTGSTDTPVTS